MSDRPRSAAARTSEGPRAELACSRRDTEDPRAFGPAGLHLFPSEKSRPFGSTLHTRAE